MRHKLSLKYGDNDLIAEVIRRIAEEWAEEAGFDSSDNSCDAVMKYGINYQNSAFMMHRYCWCEKEECQWCNGEEPNFRHFKTGLEVWWYKYIGRSMEANRLIDLHLIKRILDDCI